MDTAQASAGAGRGRRRHSDEFKAEVVRACRVPGVSIAAVSLSYGLNANMVRRWLVEPRWGVGAVGGPGVVAAASGKASGTASGTASGKELDARHKCPDAGHDVGVSSVIELALCQSAEPPGHAGACRPMVHWRAEGFVGSSNASHLNGRRCASRALPLATGSFQPKLVNPESARPSELSRPLSAVNRRTSPAFPTRLPNQFAPGR